MVCAFYGASRFVGIALDRSWHGSTVSMHGFTIDLDVAIRLWCSAAWVCLGFFRAPPLCGVELGLYGIPDRLLASLLSCSCACCIYTCFNSIFLLSVSVSTCLSCLLWHFPARGSGYAMCSLRMWPHCLDHILQPGRAATECRASLQLHSSVTFAISMCIANPCSVFRPCIHTHTFQEKTTQRSAVCTRVCLPLTMAWCNFYFTVQN